MEPGYSVNSPAFTPLTKDCHWQAAKASMGPSRCLESRTATIPGRFRATATQAPLFHGARCVASQSA